MPCCTRELEDSVGGQRAAIGYPLCGHPIHEAWDPALLLLLVFSSLRLGWYSVVCW